jgi:hypothetical protein
MAAFAGAAGCALTGRAGAVTAAGPPTGLILPTATANRRFSVLYEGDKIGFHTISYSPLTGETRVSTDVSLHVSFAFFTLFAFKHRSEEIWRGGRLVSLNSQTVEHGETLQVEGAATPEGFRVVSKDGPFIAAAATLTSNSLWTPIVLAQETVVDAQHGGIIGVSAHRLADELIPIAGRQIRATRFSFITPFLAGSIWYDTENLWVRGEFERDGTKIQYRLDM